MPIRYQFTDTLQLSDRRLINLNFQSNYAKVLKDNLHYLSVLNLLSHNRFSMLCTIFKILIVCVNGPNKGSGTFHIIHTANMMARELEIRNLLQLIYEILFNETFVTYFFLSLRCQFHMTNVLYFTCVLVNQSPPLKLEFTHDRI